jgi:DNA-binding GntR family transcriptional regulator
MTAAEKLPLPIARPKSLTDSAADAIREAIVSGRLELGEQLAEATLAASMGLSKTPVREALLRLQKEGLVTVSPQRGTFVFTLHPGELSQICELRLALESGAMLLAMERGRDALSERWQGILSDMDEALASGDIETYLTLDSDFHLALIHASANEYFSSAYELIGAKVTTLRLKLGRDAFHIGKSMDEHRFIASALQTGDIAGALGALRNHIARKEGSYWEHLDPQPSRYLTAVSPG